MAVIDLRYDSEDQIPEAHRALFTEVDGVWEATEIAGMKTEADVARVQASLNAERKAHKGTRDKLSEYKALGEASDLTEKLDRIPVLEAAANAPGAGTEDFQKAVNDAVNANLAAAKAPLEREIRRLEGKVETMTSTNKDLLDYKSERSLEDAVRPVMQKLKVDPLHHPDVMMWAKLHLEPIQGADGKTSYVAKEGIDGVVQGSDPRAWLEQMIPTKPGWLPPDVSGGAAGSTSAAPAGKNPWGPGGTIEDRAKYFAEHGEEAARKAAERAGTTLGAPPVAASS